MGATRLTDALTYTPGVKAFDSFDTRYDWLSIRGFDAYSPGFYLDGMQLRNNAGYSVWRTETYGTERIEVLRGPSSVLYGQNSPGGMITSSANGPPKNRCTNCRRKSATIPAARLRATSRGRSTKTARCYIA